MILLELFGNFLIVGLFCVGGGYAAVPLIQSRIVEGMGWLTMAEFTDLMTIAEMTPGPIVINSATFVGTRIAGFPGAVCATMGSVLPSLLIVSALFFAYRRSRSESLLSGALAALRPVVVALIASAGIGILKQALWNGEQVGVTGAVLFAISLFLLRVRRMNPIAVILLCGAASLALFLITGGC